MTPQGKVDRRALEALPLRQEPASGDRPTDHLTGVVGRVMEISLEVLGRPSLGVDEELFDAGATSLSFVRILALVNQEFGTSLSGAELDEATVRCLASVVEAARKDATGEESDDARDGHAISVRA
jgi:acyl carrier protein